MTANLPEPVREALYALKHNCRPQDECIRAISDHIAALTQQAEERARDAARLEWLEANGCDDFLIQRHAPPEIRWYDSNTRAEVGKDHFRTLRAAIDAAMQEPQP